MALCNVSKVGGALTAIQEVQLGLLAYGATTAAGAAGAMLAIKGLACRIAVP